MDSADVNRIIGGIAGRQHGVVARAQLLSAELSAHRIDGLVKRGSLEPVYRGVYAAGPIRGVRWREMAAALACGPTAAVSGRSAARLWGLPVPVQDPPIHGRGGGVEIMLRRGDRRVPGLRIRRCRSLRRDEVTRLDGVPVTTATRCLLDIAIGLGRRDLERAAAEAYARGLTRASRLRRLLMRHPGAPGTAALRALLDGASPLRTRSEAEELFLAIIRESQLSDPEANARLFGFEVDFLWSEAKLIVEIDGHAFHSSRYSVNRDHERDAALLAQGFRTLRFTWDHLNDSPAVVLRRVVEALTLARR